MLLLVGDFAVIETSGCICIFWILQLSYGCLEICHLKSVWYMMNVLSDVIALWSCHISLAYKGQPSSCPYSCLICTPHPLPPPLSLYLHDDYACICSHISYHNTDSYRPDTATACSNPPAAAAAAAAAAGRWVTEISAFISLTNRCLSQSLVYGHPYSPSCCYYEPMNFTLDSPISRYQRLDCFSVNILLLRSILESSVSITPDVRCVLIGPPHLHFLKGSNHKTLKENI